jgi:hypothetical protein
LARRRRSTGDTQEQVCGLFHPFAIPPLSLSELQKQCEMDSARWSNSRNCGETENIDGFVYAGTGDVADYGEPNGGFLYQTIPDSTGGSVRLHIEQRPCWYFYHVNVWFSRGSHVVDGVSTPWHSGVSYHAASWNAVQVVWRRFFETAGFYERVAWSCEKWMWSAEDGFEPIDYI